ARAFRHAFSTSRKDSKDSSKTADVDWIAGDSLTARWTQAADSAAATKNELRQIVARGTARSLSHSAGAKDSAATRPVIAHTRGASLPELGGLSLEDFRNSLRSSVLPRLGVMKVVRYPVGPLLDDAPVAFTPEAWAELVQEPAGRGTAADRLLQAAQLAIT